MKLTNYFQSYLRTTVNLNNSRIETLNKRVDAITSFLRQHPVFGAYFRDVIPQGSFAHRTIIKPIGNREYDADVLLAMDQHPTWTPAEYTRQLKKAFNGSLTYIGMAHSRTRCICIDYADEFHVDVVPYVEDNKHITNNKTDDWETTDPEGFTAWLDDKNRITGGLLPAVIRLLKYVRDSKTTFSIKSVLLSILVGYQVDQWRKTADSSYYADVPTALVHILEDLDDYLQDRPTMPVILDPAGTGEDFSQRWDQEGYANFRKWIHYYAAKAREAYDEGDKAKSVAAWQAIFGSDFKAPASTEIAKSARTEVQPGEQFIDRTLRIPIRLSATVRMTGRVRKVGVMRAYDLPQRGSQVGKNRDIDFEIRNCSVSPPYDVYWKVKNYGKEASDQGQLRGQIERGQSSRHEHTAYVGRHYVEVYIVKGGVCLALDRQEVIVPPGVGVSRVR